MVWSILLIASKSDTMAKEFYFNKFEDRKPYRAIPDNKYRTLFFQFAGIAAIVLGISYLNWRWRFSLNPDAMVFSVTLVTAETLSFLSTALVIFNFWSNKDPERTPPVHFLSEIEDLDGRNDRPVTIDVFIATYNEDVELVRLSIIDAKRMLYPFPDVEVRIYVLDDGKRDGRDPSKENMKVVAEQEGVGYLNRETNIGYKAGNLKNALENSRGDLFVILDADTRPFPEMLVHTTGYFRRKKVAWVQTPQWFYDTTEEEKISSIIIEKYNVTNPRLVKLIESLFGRIKANEDIYGNDPRLFYDVILRRRNYYNAAFCCGAGSIHRREAIMSLAVKDFAKNINKLESVLVSEHKSLREIHDQTNELLLTQQITPFRFHASEDIYTSIMLHADTENKWESIHHPDVECKMLSTQDLNSWIKQHKRYAEGSLDIAFKDNPLFKKGLSWGQRLCYFNTIWSYFAPLWISVFLLSPIIFFFTLQMPVKAYSFDFFKHFIPFQVIDALAVTLGCWGISTKRGDQYYISSFWFMLESLFSVISGKKVKFNVTPKDKRFEKGTRHIIAHAVIIALIVIGVAWNAILLLVGHHPSPSGFAANTFWCIFNVLALSTMIRAAYWRPLSQQVQAAPAGEMRLTNEILNS